MSRDALERRLTKHAATATRVEPTLAEKKTPPHVLRHTAAMRLQMDGIAFDASFDEFRDCGVTWTCGCGVAAPVG